MKGLKGEDGPSSDRRAGERRSRAANPLHSQPKGMWGQVRRQGPVAHLPRGCGGRLDGKALWLTFQGERFNRHHQLPYRLPPSGLQWLLPSHEGHLRMKGTFA
jgi:hypothetical protein